MKKSFSKLLAVTAMLLSMTVFAFTGCGSKASSTTDWVNQDEMQQVVKTMSDSQSDMSIALIAVDDKTVSFQFTFTEQLDIPDEATQDLLVDTFDQQMAAQESVFIEMRDQLVKDTKIDDVVLRIEYLNADGSVIYSKDYTK